MIFIFLTTKLNPTYCTIPYEHRDKEMTKKMSVMESQALLAVDLLKHIFQYAAINFCVDFSSFVLLLLFFLLFIKKAISAPLHKEVFGMF